jgi:hypothetical protein
VPDFSLLGGDQQWLEGSQTNSRGTSVTPGGSPGVEGSYAQLISAASNTVNASGLLVSISVGGLIRYMVDIAVGAAGSEVIIAPNLYAEGGVGLRQNFQYFLPISIPAGTRIAARAQSTGTAAAFVLVDLVGKVFSSSAGLQRVTTYGVTEAAVVGTHQGGVLGGLVVDYQPNEDVLSGFRQSDQCRSDHGELPR